MHLRIYFFLIFTSKRSQIWMMCFKNQNSKYFVWWIHRKFIHKIISIFLTFWVIDIYILCLEWCDNQWWLAEQYCFKWWEIIISWNWKWRLGLVDCWNPKGKGWWRWSRWLGRFWLGSRAGAPLWHGKE